MHFLIGLQNSRSHLLLEHTSDLDVLSIVLIGVNKGLNKGYHVYQESSLILSLICE